jgi:hypothetical protein
MLLWFRLCQFTKFDMFVGPFQNYVRWLRPPSLLTMCLVETLGTKCKVFIYIYPLYFVITYIGFIDTSIDHFQSFILVPCYVCDEILVDSKRRKSEKG